MCRHLKETLARRIHFCDVKPGLPTLLMPSHVCNMYGLNAPADRGVEPGVGPQPHRLRAQD